MSFCEPIVSVSEWYSILCIYHYFFSLLLHNVHLDISRTFSFHKWNYYEYFYKFCMQFSSVTQLCPILCNPVNCSTPGLPVHHQHPESTQTHVHPVSDAIQPSCPPLSPSPPAPNPSQHYGLLQWVNSSHEVAKVLKFQLQHQSFQWTPKTDIF